jgi:hypothetical protein
MAFDGSGRIENGLSSCLGVPLVAKMTKPSGEAFESNKLNHAENLPFSKWGKVVTDPRLVAAIVDRVTFQQPHRRDRQRELPSGHYPSQADQRQGDLTQRTFCINALALAKSNAAGSKGPLAHSSIRSCSSCSGSVTASRNSV